MLEIPEIDSEISKEKWLAKQLLPDLMTLAKCLKSMFLQDPAYNFIFNPHVKTRSL